MNEPRRLAYLDALGIDAYISRRQLPAAAPSRRLAVVKPRELPAVDAPPPAEPGREPSLAPELLSSIAPVQSERRGERESVVRAPESPEHGEPETTPMFSVAACFLAGYCWLEEIPRAREPGENYLQLLLGISLALGREGASPVLERFDWPMHHNRQLGQGQESARHAFEGFIRARLERFPVHGVVLLGDCEGGWLEPAVFADLDVVSTVSVRGMLRHPELKVQAWRDLKRLAATGA